MMGDDGIPGLGSDFQLAEDTSGVESSILEGNPGRGRNAAGDKKKTPAAAAGAASPRPSPEAEEHLRNMLAEKNAALAICEAKKAEVLKKLSDLAGDYGSQYDSIKATIESYYEHHAAEVSHFDRKHQDLEQRLAKAGAVVAGLHNMTAAAMMVGGPGPAGGVGAAADGAR